MPATKVKSLIIPVSPKKRYRFLIEWVATGTSDLLTVGVKWFDKTESVITTWTLMSETATTANAWQVSTRALVPPETARFAQLLINKPNVSTKFGINRLELKESDFSLERKLREITIVDDFSAPTIGMLPWIRYDYGGTFTASKVNGSGAFGNWSEFGITRLSTGATSGYGGAIHLEQLGEGPPPVGTEFRCKIRMQDTTNLRCWVGLWSALAVAGPDAAVANVVEGIGFRAEPAGSAVNWFGVVRDNNSEATQDMGVLANSTWRNLGWYITDTGGIQFTLKGVAVGTVKTTDIPQSTTQLAPIFGLVTAANAAKEADIDFFGLQLFLNRI